MVKEYAIKGALYSSVSLASLFSISGPIEACKNFLGRQYSEAKQTIVSTIAESSGYVLPMDEFTALELAEREALRAKINPALVRAVIHVESSGKLEAQSHKGAISYMQVMPFNYKRCKLDNAAQLWIPESNIKCGVQILAEELKVYKGDLVSALMVYNGGPKAIARQYPESVKYSKLVLAKLATDIR